MVGRAGLASSTHTVHADTNPPSTHPRKHPPARPPTHSHASAHARTHVAPAVDPLGKVANFIRLRGRLEAQPFSFLNLGLLAYVGQQEALAQVQTGNIKVGGSLRVCGGCGRSRLSRCHAHAHTYIPCMHTQLGEYSSRAGNLLWR